MVGSTTEIPNHLAALHFQQQFIHSLDISVDGIDAVHRNRYFVSKICRSGNAYIWRDVLCVRDKAWQEAGGQVKKGRFINISKGWRQFQFFFSENPYSHLHPPNSACTSCDENILLFFTCTIFRLMFLQRTRLHVKGKGHYVCIAP